MYFVVSFVDRHCGTLCIHIRYFVVSSQPGGEGREGASGGKGAGPSRHLLAVGWRGPPAAFVLLTEKLCV
jgi:hypothetical protein